MSVDPEMDQWGSHLPLLAAAVAATEGGVLECGVGVWSTPVLHGLTTARGRQLLSLESNPSWCARFHGSGAHRVELIKDWRDGLRAAIGDLTFSVVFVDHGEAPRGPVVSALRDRADMIVMHDSECGYCGYSEPLQGFDWVYTHTHSPAWTTIAGRGARPSWVERLAPGAWGVPRPYR